LNVATLLLFFIREIRRSILVNPGFVLTGNLVKQKVRHNQILKLYDHLQVHFAFFANFQV